MDIKENIIVVIGLPGSGKTFLSNRFKDRVVFDDFITNFYDGILLKTVREGKKILINDPRLCIYKIFINVIDKITQFVRREDVHLILFENNPIDCINNIADIADIADIEPNKKRGLEFTITTYSKQYDLNNYKEWNNTILPVYKN